MLGVLQWFIGLGSTVFLPIVIIIIALLIWCKTIKSSYGWYYSRYW